jgi:septal ring factor EnvC (AmiA/AmiB activator)
MYCDTSAISQVQAAGATDTKPRKRAKHMRTWSKAARTEMDEALDDLIDSLDGELAVAVAKAEAAAARAEKAAQAAEQAAVKAEAQAQAVPPSGEVSRTRAGQGVDA